MNIIITGASRGIGKAIAEIFASNGYDLFLTSQNDMALYKAAEDLSTRFEKITVRAKPFDLANKEQAIACGEWTLSQGVVPDIIVNNVGIFQPGVVANEAEGALEKQIETNLYSAYHLTRSLLPSLIKRRSGHVFNICSIASLDAYKPGAGYSISKFALYGFSKNLREEMKPHGVKVTTVLPGPVLTDSWGDFDNSSNRILLPEDIAKMVYACAGLSVQACVEEILIRPQLGDMS
jgi:short-subunit dehydrogenase